MKLDEPVSTLKGVGESLNKKLTKLGIKSIEDLLYHIPLHYSDYRNLAPIDSVKIGETVTVIGQIVSIQNIYTKKGKKLQMARLSDGDQEIDIIWMNQPFLTRVLPPNTLVSLSGKVGFWGKRKVISFPQFEKLIAGKDTIHTGSLVANYPETNGLTSKWIRRLINNTLRS